MDAVFASKLGGRSMVGESALYSLLRQRNCSDPAQSIRSDPEGSSEDIMKYLLNFQTLQNQATHRTGSTEPMRCAGDGNSQRSDVMNEDCVLTADRLPSSGNDHNSSDKFGSIHPVSTWQQQTNFSSGKIPSVSSIIDCKGTSDEGTTIVESSSHKPEGDSPSETSEESKISKGGKRSRDPEKNVLGSEATSAGLEYESPPKKSTSHPHEQLPLTTKGGSRSTSAAVKYQSTQGSGGRRQRRGTATDPQSLASRARREKISHRLKCLQEIVPGCSDLDTASMLDQAIDYVHNLQETLRAAQNAKAQRAQVQRVEAF